MLSVDDSEVSPTVWAKYLGASERSYLVLSENFMDCWILMVINKMSTFENAAFQYFFFADLTVTPKHTWKNSVGFFIYICPNRDFLLPSAEETITHFGYFSDNNFGSKHDNKTNYPIFFISPLSFIHCYIYFLHLKTLKIQFHGVPLSHYFLVCKINFMPNITF